MSRYVAATALYRDDRNNHQVNYQGELSQVTARFNEEMEQRGALWGRLFDETNGEPLDHYLPADVRQGSTDLNAAKGMVNHEGKGVLHLLNPFGYMLVVDAHVDIDKLRGCAFFPDATAMYSAAAVVKGLDFKELECMETRFQLRHGEWVEAGPAGSQLVREFLNPGQTLEQYIMEWTV